jgi:hypothetical protein
MDTKKSIAIFLSLSFVVLGVFALVWAGTTQLALKAEKPHAGASGTLSISENSLSIEAKGLRPNGVYTVWFVNMKPKKQEAGAGQAPYMFKTDGEGNGTYTSSLGESPFGKWAVVMIVLHPKGDPANMKDMVPALSAMIPKSGS